MIIIEGQYRIPVERDLVWKALNDPDVLKVCIPGCESFVAESENKFAADVCAAVGPIRSTFSMKITLSDIRPPHAYCISGEGKGPGAVGFARGSADVTLVEDGDETDLLYEANVKVGGKLAQVGSRLIQSAARILAEQFFGNLTLHLAPDATLPGGGRKPFAARAIGVAIVIAILIVLGYWLTRT